MKNGSDSLVYRDRLPESAGVDFTIATARITTRENHLCLILLGPITDSAIVLLKAPDIAENVVVLSHGRSF